MGYCDACCIRAGKVWLPGTKHIEPIMWQVKWPDNIKAALITRENPKRTISVSNLEMAGLLLHYLVLGHVVALCHENMGVFCNKSPTVPWLAKLVSKRSRIVGWLLRALALCQQV